MPTLGESGFSTVATGPSGGGTAVAEKGTSSDSPCSVGGAGWQAEARNRTESQYGVFMRFS